MGFFMKKNKPASKEKGQSLVELALTATLMMFLLLGAVDFGFAFLDWIIMRDAAQEGASYGSLHPGPLCENALDQWVYNASTTPLITFDSINNPLQIVVTRTGTLPGQSITVKLTYIYNVLIPFQPLLPTTIPISTSVTNTILKTDTTCP